MIHLWVLSGCELADITSQHSINGFANLCCIIADIFMYKTESLVHDFTHVGPMVKTGLASP
jgi:hypothetical protein